VFVTGTIHYEKVYKIIPSVPHMSEVVYCLHYHRLQPTFSCHWHLHCSTKNWNDKDRNVSTSM